MPMPIPPDTPADISVFYEDGKFLFRVEDSRSIYVRDGEQSRQSACTNECLKKWHPVIASRGSKPVGGWTLAKRSDGTAQWCYHKQPVYTFVSDRPGDTKGEGADGVWHVVVP